MAASAQPPLLLLFGDDDLAIKQRAKTTFEEWCKESGGFDQERISGTAANSGEALDALGRLREAMQTLPFFGAKVIWFQNCNFLGTDRTAESSAVSEAVTSLADDFKKFDWRAVKLIITADAVDKRKTFYKTIAKVGAAEEMSSWSVDDRDWTERAEGAAVQLLRSAGKSIAPDALARLVTDAGMNNRHLANEVEKLVLYVGERAQITIDDIETIISRNPQSRAFALADAVGARDLPRLVRTLDCELRDMKGNSKKSEIGLLYGVISKVRAMLLAKELARKGYVRDNAQYGEFQGALKRIPAADLPADKRFNPLSMHPFMLHGALQHSRNYTIGELVAAMEALLAANLSLISTGLDEALILQQTLIRIVQPSAKAGARKT